MLGNKIDHIKNYHKTSVRLTLKIDFGSHLITNRCFEYSNKILILIVLEKGKRKLTIQLRIQVEV